MQKILKIMLFTTIFFLASKTSFAGYTLQIKALPMDDQQAGLKLYNSLKNKQYLVYYYTAEVKDKPWLRIRLGYFTDKADAKRFGETFKQKEKLDYFVDEASLTVETYQKQFKVLTTPSAVWLQSPEKNKLLYDFETVNALDLLDNTHAMISPTGKTVVFYYDEKLIQVDINTSKSQILKEDVLNAQPQWSHDGQYIGYLDYLEWETETNLCIIQANNAQSRCLTDNEQSQKAVKSFHWHPQKNQLFFVEGHAFGTVSVGGNLYRIDTTGKRKAVVLADTEKREEIGAEFTIKADSIHYSLYQFDEQYIHKTQSQHNIKLPE